MRRAAQSRGHGIALRRPRQVMPLIVGHRGARGLWAENSLRGFREAAALGVDAIEFDIHACRDGEIAVIHDATLERTTRAAGMVSALCGEDLPQATLRDIDGEGVPSLDQVLDILQPTTLELQIEIKTDALGNRYPALEPRLVGKILARGLQARTIVVSFVPEILEYARACWPDARLLASLDRRSAELLGGLSAALDRMASLPGCIVAIEKGLLRQTFAFCLERLGSDRLGVWTPNEADEIVHWMGAPIRHVVTDRPDLALAARTRR
jgi:glycerophosphoryl diester phosphodiesterase